MGNAPSIKEEYRRARAAALQAAKERKELLFAAVPELEALEAERRKATFELGPALIASADKQSVKHEYAERIAKLNTRFSALLLENGLSETYLNPVFRCNICEDTGYIGTQRVPCACLRARLLEQEHASSGLHATFNDFDSTIFKNETQKKVALAACKISQIYADSLSYNGARGLLLMGNVGLGKTFLLDCVGSAALKNGFSVQKYTAYNLIDNAARAIRNRSQDLVSAETLSYSDLLIIDDLGAEPIIPNITIEVLFSIINERQNAKRALAIATNLSKRDLLNVYGERIFSRLTTPREFSVLELMGDNLR